MVDTYTKICLTVIAVSLAVIGLRGLPVIDPAYAQSGVHKIAICDESGRKCATMDSYGRRNFLLIREG